MSEDYSEAYIRYMEMIQDTIKRMSNFSFNLKGWAVTLLAGTFAILNLGAKPEFLWFSLVPVFFFWILDAFYLLQERMYRKMYEDVLEHKDKKPYFNMDARAYKNTKAGACFFKCLFAKVERRFYIPLMLGYAAIVWFLMK